MSLLGNLRVRLTAETEDFRRGLEGARRNLYNMQRDLNKFRNHTLANVASIGAFTAALKSSLDVANQYDNAQRQLAATAKLTGVQLGFLQSVSKGAQDQFRLSAISANSFTIEMAKLAEKAGDVGKASDGLAAFLDIGAARGMSADQTLKAVQQSILGIDEGTDKLFSKNPSVLYEEFAAKIGTTAGRLTDQQKAQALLNAAMEDGGKVRGEYQKWLQSSQGQQYLLSQSIEQTQAVLGKALQPALVAIIPIVAKLAEGVQMAIRGWQMLGATLALIPGAIEAAKAGMKGGAEEAKKVWGRWRDAWADEIASIQGQVEEIRPFTLGVSPQTADSAQETGKKVARTLFDSLESEWERLRHSVALLGIEVTGTDQQRNRLEYEHATRMLAIDRARVEEERKAGILSAEEYRDAVKQLEIRQRIEEARYREIGAALRANETLRAQLAEQDMLLSHRLETERILNDGALTRLRGEENIGERLALQLELAERTYQLQKASVLSDVRLTDMQRQQELERLRLAREREELQLRTNAAAEEELRLIREQANARRKAADHQKAMAEQLAGIGAGLLGGNTSAAGIGSALGGVAATALKLSGPIGAVAGTLLPSIGSKLFGGLFGKKQERPDNPIVKGLQAIERAQKETITSIQQQTESLLKPEQRLMNLPATFAIPSYNPSIGKGRSGGNTTVNYGATNVSLEINVSAPGFSPEDIRRLAMEGVSDALGAGRRNASWAYSPV